MNEKPWVKSYAGGNPNYCTPQPEVCCGEYARCLKVCIPKERWFAQQKLNVDAVNMSQDRVDETAKGEHEPVGWLDSEGRFSYFKHLDSDEPLYTAPPKKEWVGLTDEEIVDLACSVDSYKGLVQAVEAKLKEKNSGN